MSTRSRKRRVSSEKASDSQTLIEKIEADRIDVSDGGNLEFKLGSGKSLDENEGSDGEEGSEESEMSEEEEEDSDAESSSSDEEEESEPEISETDSSDEEDLRNTIGNIPVSWYNELAHVGYDSEGKKIPKKGVKRTEIEELLARMEDPDYWRKVEDERGEEVKLSDKEVALVQNMQTGKYPEIGYNPYEPYVDFFTHEVMEHPVSNRPPNKNSFIPSKLDKQKVSRMVYAIKMGWLKPRKKEEKTEEDDQPNFYDLWGADGKGSHSKSEAARLKMQMPAPKTALPDHSESYNPPPEYLLTDEEKAKWESKEKYERSRNFIPQKYDSYRRVPAFAGYVNERFERCLDLYLAPRMRKEKLNVEMEQLLPELPLPKDLQPFPSTLALTYRGHKGLVRAVAVEPVKGEFMASGGDDQRVCIWEISSGRLLRTIPVGDVIHAISWNPNLKQSILAIAAGKSVVLANAGAGSKHVVSHTSRLLGSMGTGESSWEKVSENMDSPIFKISHDEEVKVVNWHSLGDYLVSVCPGAGARALVVHQLSTMKSEFPLAHGKKKIQSAVFHPTQPLLFVAEERHVKVYNLVKQELVKKMLPNSKSISCIALHPKGDNLLCGGHDCRITWFDMDLSTKPYKTFRHFHKGAVRCLAFHQRHPLFASVSDDASAYIFHGRVFSDLLKNPLIVPVKRLGGHKEVDSLGVLHCTFHPTQPWIITAGADGTLKLYTN